jgi:hypothetical protein
VFHRRSPARGPRDCLLGCSLVVAGEFQARRSRSPGDALWSLCPTDGCSTLRWSTCTAGCVRFTSYGGDTGNLPRDILQKILDDATGQSGVHDDLADHVSGFTDPSRSLHRDVLAA